MPRNPELRLKESAEAEWAAGLAGILSDQYDELERMLSGGNPQDPGIGWWDGWRATIAAFLGVSLLNLSHSATELAMSRYAVGVDWDSILTASQNWASNYSFNLVRGINATSQQALQRLLSQYYSGAINHDTLIEMLSGHFGPTRASNIAATEVTRAYEEGMDLYQEELDRLGIGTDRVWRAEPDACPICAVYDGTLESEGWESSPPLHPSCRCFTEILILPGEKHFTLKASRNAFV